MKAGDYIAVGYAIFWGCLVYFFPLGMVDGSLRWVGFRDGLLNFGAVTAAFPYPMGFLKVAFLATYGEMIKNRGKTGSYGVDHFWTRFIVWGLYGLLFTYVFALFAKGVGALMGTKLWFGVPVTQQSTLWDRFLFAFSTSFWINLIFAYPMMLFHEWCNHVIDRQRFVGGGQFLTEINKPFWGSFIPKTIIFFWIPAHTVTFLLPGDYRVLMAAALSVALGFILTFKPKNQ